MTDDPTDAESAWPAWPGRQGLRQAWRTLGIVAHTRPGLAVAIAVFTVAAALLPPAALYVSKLIVDGVVTAIESGAAADRNAALVWVAVESGLLAVLLAVRRILVFLKGQLHAELGFAVSDMILAKADAFSLAQIEDAEIQERIILARQFAASRPYNLVNRIFEAAQHGLTLVSILVLLAAHAPWLVALVVLGGLPVFIGNLRFSGDAYRFYTGRTPQMRERSYLESLLTQEGSARERLHFGLGPELRRRFSALFEALHGEDTRLKARQTFFGSALGLTGAAVFLGGKLWIVAVTIAGRFTLGEMTMLVGLLKQGQAGVNNLLSSFAGSYEDLLYVASLFTLLDMPVEDREAGAAAGPLPGDGLRFENVGFTYPGRARPALDNVSFHLPPGCRLGLVGANGSGKTTLVKLAAGLYMPDTGRVTLDGLDLKHWNGAALRARIGAMFQPHVNYKLTLKDNIAAGAGLAEPDPGRLDRAIERGLATDLVRDLPGGLEARLSKRFLDGLELSGGQWQRLAMARAHLNETADILILDEPTAAMDAAAEAEFMARDLGGKSLILISHRLANLRSADVILVLEKGRIAECGEHDALIAAGGVYADLFETQAEAYR
ncbi:ABC transporter ATP-binding protein [Maricaulis sp.]|uniref:ABC transporter ATP-binding protein n=1 Tax=Maricaulis sp. TaxID=1486257 RepID=UPI00260601A3|nr:ABC transporter ATP-binding protein [Maricaulis sp.]